MAVSDGEAQAWVTRGDAVRGDVHPWENRRENVLLVDVKVPGQPRTRPIWVRYEVGAYPRARGGTQG
jgi:hypothetical protein